MGVLPPGRLSVSREAQCPQTVLSPRRRSRVGPSGLLRSAALQVLEPQRRRHAPGLGRSRPHCGMHFLPLTNSLQEPPALLPAINLPAGPSGPQWRRPDRGGNQVRNSCWKSKAGRGPQGGKKTGGGGGNREQEFSQTRFPFSALLSRRCTPAHALSLRFGARPPAQHPLVPFARARARTPQSQFTIPCPLPAGLCVGDSHSTNSSSSSQPARIPREVGGKAAPIPWRSGRRRTQPRRRLHHINGAPGCADLSIYLPPRLLPARSGDPDLYLRRRCVGGVPVSSSPLRAFRERRGPVFPLELVLLLRSSSSRLGPSPRRPAPRSTPPRGTPPLS